MAVTIHNTTLTAGPTSAAARTVLHTATAGSVLLVWTHTNEAVTMSAVAAGTNPLTRLTFVSASGSRSELWGLTAPPSGTLTISAAPVGANVATWAMIATTYTGARQVGGSPFGTPVAGTSGATTTVDFSVSSTSTDLVAFGFGISANTTLAFNNGTTRGTATHSTTGRLVVGDIAGASTVSISATAGASVVWSMLAVPLVVAPTTNIAFDNAAGTSTAVANNTVGLLLTATSNAVLLVFLNNTSGNGTVSSVAIGATQLTRLGAGYYRTAASRRAEVWGLTAPPSGVLTISAVLANSEATNLGIYAVTYTGARPTSPFGGVVFGSASDVAATQFSFSSDTGNLAVFGFMFDNPDNGSVGAGLTKRLSTTTYLPGMIADAPGSTVVTGTATTGTPAYWGFLGVNLIVNDTAATISAIAAFTDPADTFVAPTKVIVRGTLAATDIVDRFTAVAKTIIRGTVNATDVVDTLSAAAKVRISGRLSATEAFADTFAATAFTRVTARLSATEAADTFAASGRLIIRGTLAATDAPDTFAASGTVANSNINGTFAATDAPDTFAAAAAVRITGALAATDTADTFAATSKVIVRGLLAATDTPDVFAATGLVLGSYRTAIIAATDAPDTFSAPAYVVVRGLAAFTDTPDTFVALANNISESAAVVTILQDGGSGGGGSKRKKPPYIRAPEDFWTIRERHLKSIHEEMVESAEPAHSEFAKTESPIVTAPQLASYRIERASVIQKLTQAEDRPKLYNRTKRLKQLNAHIAEQKRQQQLLAQKLAEQKRLEKKRRNLARARKLKKAVKLLAIARALSTLTYLYGKL